MIKFCFKPDLEPTFVSWDISSETAVVEGTIIPKDFLDDSGQVEQIEAAINLIKDFCIQAENKGLIIPE